MTVEELLTAERLARRAYEQWRKPDQPHWWESDEFLRTMMIAAVDAGMHAVGREAEQLLDKLQPLQQAEVAQADGPVPLQRDTLRRIIAALAREEVNLEE